MTKRITALPITLLLMLAPAALAGGAQKAATKTPAGAVATIQGRAITQAELDEAVGARLMRVKTEEYNIRRGALDQIISDRLLDAEAARRGITKDELLRVEVDQKVASVPQETLESVYDGMKERFGNTDRAEAIRQIEYGMRRQKLDARRAELLRGLSNAAGVKIYLEPPRTDLVANVGPSQGPESAPITIVEFSDFECSFCNRALPTIKKLQERYGDRLRFVFRDYVLPSHRNAPKAAEAAHCAGDQGKYWEMHDRLFANQRELSPLEFIKFANDLKLDPAAFEQCLSSGRHHATWQSAHADGERAGVRSTPTFFINGRMIIGAASPEAFMQVIDEELERAGVALPASQAVVTTAAK